MAGHTNRTLLWFCSLLAASFAMNGYDWRFKSMRELMPRALLLKPNGELFGQLPNTFTICFYVRIEVNFNEDLTLVSYASKETGEANEVYFDVNFAEKYSSLSINGRSVVFNVVPRRAGWQHICISWNHVEGEARLHFDGKEKLSTRGSRLVREGYKIGGQGCFVLAQDQDSFNGGYDYRQGLSGSMSQIRIWSRVLTTYEVKLLTECKMSGGDVADWNQPSWGLTDNVQVVKTTAPCYNSCGFIKTNPCINRRPTYTSRYDLTSGIADWKPRDVQATLKNHTFEATKAFTFCFQLYNRETNFQMNPIAYHDYYGNEILSFGFRTGEDYGFYFTINGVSARVSDGLIGGTTTPFCITWSSATGNVSIYYQGDLHQSVDNMQKGYVIPGDGKLSIMQRQFAPLNKIFTTLGFRYKISDFYAWNRCLTADEVASFRKCTGAVDDYVINADTSEWDVVDKGCPAYSKKTPISGRATDYYGDKEIAGLLQIYEKAPPSVMMDISMCFWVYTTKDDPTCKTCFSTSNDTSFSCDQGAVVFKINGTTATFPANSYFSANSWQNLCITWKGSNGKTKLYVNCKKAEEVSGISPGYTFEKGQPWVYKNWINGPPDERDPTRGYIWKATEFNLYNWTLSADEVKQICECSLTVQGNVINSRSAIWKRLY